MAEHSPVRNSGRQGDGVPYGKVPFYMVTPGIVGDLNRSELALYLVICAHVNGETWIAYPSVWTLANKTGLSQRTVQRTTKRLQKKGMIEVESRRGRGNTNNYKVVTKPDTMDDGVYGSNKSENPDNQSDGGFLSKPVIPNPKTRHPRGQNPSISTLKPDTQGDGGTAEQQEQQQQQGIAADDERSDLKKTLERHGLESAEYLLGTPLPCEDFPASEDQLEAAGMLTSELISRFMGDISTNAGPGARVEHFRKKMASEYQNAQGRAAAEADLDDRQRELLKECRRIGWTFGPDFSWLKWPDLTADAVRQVVSDCGGDRDRAAKLINRTNFDSPS